MLSPSVMCGQDGLGQPLGHPPGLVLVGGGLANSLIAYRLRQKRPGLPITVLERGPRLGGNHTWSFHETDVSPEILAWLRPFIVHRWGGQSVRFGNRRRSFRTPYCSITSERLHELMSWTLGPAARSGVEVARVAPDRVETADGEVIPARAVIDGRGTVPRRHLDLGWQKFVGLEVRTSVPHGLTRPVIMDATIPQLDGFRFIYVLPLARDRLLIEDTRYSDAPAYCRRSCVEDILAYAADRGWSVETVLRCEEGALPIALDGDIEAICAEMGEVARSGLAAALFHPTTGYSLPDAAKLAERIAAAPRLDADTLPGLVSAHARAAWRRAASTGSSTACSSAPRGRRSATSSSRISTACPARWWSASTATG